MAYAYFRQKIISGRMTKYKGSAASIAPGLVFGAAILASNGAFAACAPVTAASGPTEVFMASDGNCSGDLSANFYHLGNSSNDIPPLVPYASVNVTIAAGSVLATSQSTTEWRLYDDTHLTIAAGATIAAPDAPPSGVYAVPPLRISSYYDYDAYNQADTMPNVVVTLQSSDILKALHTDYAFDGTAVTATRPSSAYGQIMLNHPAQMMSLVTERGYAGISTVRLDNVSNDASTSLTLGQTPSYELDVYGGVFGLSRLSVENGSNVYISNTLFADPMREDKTFDYYPTAALLGDPERSGLIIDARSTVNTVPMHSYIGTFDEQAGVSFQVNQGEVPGLTIIGNMTNSGRFNMANGQFEYFELANQYADNRFANSKLREGYFGHYRGDGGTIVMDVALGDDSSAHDTLWISGNVTGKSYVEVVNLGGKGAQTVNGIPLIHVGGTADANAFELKKSVVAGAYEYNELVNRKADNQLSTGKQSTTSQTWYLMSKLVDVPVDPVDPVDPEVPAKPQYQPLVPVVEALPFATRQDLGTYRDRRAGRHYATPENTTFCKDAAQNFRCAVTPEQNEFYAGAQSAYALGGSGFWMQVDGGYEAIDLRHSTTGVDLKTNKAAASFGYDAVVSNGEQGDVIAGGFVKYINSSSDTNSRFGWGGIDTDGYAVGATLTYVGKSGLYLDTQLQYTRLNSSLWGESARFRSTADGINSDAFNIAAELGQTFALSDGLKLTPSLRLDYSHTIYDRFSDNFGAEVEIDDADFLTLEGGLLLDGSMSFLPNTRWYAGPLLSYELLGRPSIQVSGIGFEPEMQPFWGTFALGFDHAWNGGNASFYGNVKLGSALAEVSDNFRATARLGVNVKW